MNKLAVLFLCIFTFNNYLCADFVSTVSFKDIDGVSVDLYSVSGINLLQSIPVLVECFWEYYKKHEKVDCPPNLSDNAQSLLYGSAGKIVIVAYKDGACVGWTVFTPYHEDKVFYLEDIRVWFSSLYAQYLILSIYKLSSLLDFKIDLNCDKNNLNAQCFFRKLGFNPIPTCELLPCLIMEYSLSVYVNNVCDEIKNVSSIISMIERGAVVMKYAVYICDPIYDNLNQMESFFEKMRLYDKSRMQLISDLVGSSYKDYVLSFINVVNNLELRFNNLKLHSGPIENV